MVVVFDAVPVVFLLFLARIFREREGRAEDTQQGRRDRCGPSVRIAPFSHRHAKRSPTSGHTRRRESKSSRDARKQASTDARDALFNVKSDRSMTDKEIGGTPS